ncbi:unnamed protein product [Phaeothamnion confervicola]
MPRLAPFREPIYGGSSLQCSIPLWQFFLYWLAGPNAPQHPCPSNVDQRAWEEAQRDNPDPDKLVPYLVVGFDELLQQAQERQTEAAKMNDLAQRLREMVGSRVQQSRRAAAAAEACRRKHVEQRHRLLQVMQKMELLRCINLPLHDEERRLRDRLEQVMVHQQGLRQRLKELVAWQSQASVRGSYSEAFKSDSSLPLFRPSYIASLWGATPPRNANVAELVSADAV